MNDSVCNKTLALSSARASGSESGLSDFSVDFVVILRDGTPDGTDALSVGTPDGTDAYKTSR